ncbi:SCO7613 C-terminal domain-containing membrane protein [Streptomyces sp. NPDC091272]|uniref:SCO7613 C-terminal domain-containing membrane protein n=1 Tax=Streptomyces sp. NPDC091272 TaxID=3365981 RepID=UPI003808DB52
MTNVPPLGPADELVLLDRELTQLDVRKRQLLLRRDWLVQVLNQPSAAPPHAARPNPAGRPAPPPRSAPGARTLAGTPRATSGAQNVLLTLGGILLAVAALAFTLVGWGQLGIAGRSAALGLVTVAALAAPVLLVRRGLAATAESIGVVGLLLTVLDAYALHQVAFENSGAVAYCAGAAALLALLWTVYGLLVPGLRVPLPAALSAAQLPLVLLASVNSSTALPVGWALLATAAADTATALLLLHRRVGPAPSADRTGPSSRRFVPVGVLAAVCAWAAGGCVLLVALVLSSGARTTPVALAPSGLFLACAALALAASLRRPQVATALAAGLTLTAAVVGAVRPAVPFAWTAPVCLLCALVVLALSRAGTPRLPRPVRTGLAVSAAVVGGGAVLQTVPALALTVLWGPASRAAAPWQGRPTTFRDTIALDVPWHAFSTAPLILLATAAALAVLHRRSPGPATAVGTVLPASAAVLLLPTSLDLSHSAALGVQLAVTAAALILAALTAAPSAATVAPGVRSAVSYSATAVAAVTAGSVSCLALASRGGTFAVFGTLLVLCTALAVRAPSPALRAAGAVAWVGYATGLLCAGAAALALAPQQAALLVLVVPAAVALLAAWTPHAPAELAATAPMLLAVALAAGEGPMLSLVLALCGVIAAGTAVRGDRRPVGWAAGALFLLATWVRLAASGVGEPEAYTLPVSVLALAVGALRRRHDPRASSWVAYGPGLAVTMLPSLVAVVADPHWLRPLLLGLGALVVTLLGARHRLGAPLLLGGAVLALVALHELAPYVVQVAGALPRWLPPALAGLLLLVVGATYEQRLRDARRLRSRLGRLH